MCNALSPERAVLWAVLHDAAVHRRVGERLHDGLFTTAFHRACFTACRTLRAAGAGRLEETAVCAAPGTAFSDSERRALARMLRVEPPARVRDNVDDLVAALDDRAHGRAVNLLRLVN